MKVYFAYPAGNETYRAICQMTKEILEMIDPSISASISPLRNRDRKDRTEHDSLFAITNDVETCGIYPNVLLIADESKQSVRDHKRNISITNILRELLILSVESEMEES